MYYNLDGDIKNIQLALEWAYQLKMWLEVGEFVDNLVEFLDRRGLWNELVKYSEIAIETGREINDKHLIMRHKIFGLGWVKAVRFGKYDEALVSIQEGKNLAQELNNEREYAIALRDEGVVYMRVNEYQKAKDLFLASLDIWQKLGDQRWEIRTLGSIGANEKRQENLNEAFDFFTEALKKSEETGDSEQIALNLRRLTEIWLHRQEFEKASSAAREGLRISTQLNILDGIAVCSMLLAKTEYELGKTDNAKELAEKAMEIFIKLGTKRELDETQALLAQIEAEAG
ncbi:MAG: tetratricopeptide repeat protein [Anaerolineales bacterium]|nr:tetratricopeptide repeat protein [Anaerolineales bacterium]